MKTILNYTPHTITTQVNGAQTIYPSVGVARVSVSSEVVAEVNGTPVSKVTYGEVLGLPEAQDDTIVVVSGMVLAALKGYRLDVVGPDTGPTAIRENGQVIAVRGFVQ